jgi:hypothetical protein
METMNNEPLTFCDAALHYTERGIAVFPLCPRSKIPAVKKGFYNATTDHNQIRAWWTENPRYNVAIAPGEVSSVIVIDVDGIEGEKSLTELEAKCGTLPVTVTQITPGKIENGQHVGTGRHLIYKTGGMGFGSRQGIA